MLPRLFDKCSDGAVPKIIKYVCGEDATAKGAFSFGAQIKFRVLVPRKLGVSSVVMRICRDGNSDAEYPLSFEGFRLGVDSYSVVLDTKAMCGDNGYGLFFYEFLFVRGNDGHNLFTDSINGVDFELCGYSHNRFRLLVYKSDFKTPEWFGGAVMYHIFADRFCRGKGEVEYRDDAEINGDWDRGVPQYPEKPGDPVSNNVFFGGNLWGVIEKLDYLQSLGVNVIYLSPIFRAYSNHRYDTADYGRVDGLLGGDTAFAELIKAAKKRNMHIILDGVFNHTGDDSVYFDRYGKFGGNGAYCSKDSPYYNWYNFTSYPDKYESWWGIEILPKLNLNCPECRDYFVGEGGIVERYIKQGIDGWRLDVADELNDDFLDRLRAVARKASNDREDKPCDALIIGEVWENASDKVSYGRRRRYLCGDQLDSVMNYPVRNAIISFVRDGDADMLYNTLTELYSSYPECVCNALMNILGTHDTERILTVLGTDDRKDFERPNAQLALAHLPQDRRDRALRLLMMASAIQYTVFGVPSLFYGDEAGTEGFHDPFCRMPFPWGRENAELLAHYRRLGEIRKNETVFDGGSFSIIAHAKNFIAYKRTKAGRTVLVAANRGNAPYSLNVGQEMTVLYCPCTDSKVMPDGTVSVEPDTIVIVGGNSCDI